MTSEDDNAISLTHTLCLSLLNKHRMRENKSQHACRSFGQRRIRSGESGELEKRREMLLRDSSGSFET